MRCVSFCLAEGYRLPNIAVFFRSQGYEVKQYRKVVHISKENIEQHIFIFSYGCVVIWNMKHRDEKILLNKLQSFSINSSNTTKTSKFIYRYGDHVEIMTHERFNLDIIILESDSYQLKLAISYGLAQSVQLELFESEIQNTIDQNSYYPKQLAKNGNISLSRKEISQRLGQLFLARSSINLNSEYLAIPEYFWENPNFENYYNMSKKFLDIQRRVSTLNRKLDILHELFGMLTTQLQYRHSNILEWIIIILIFVEIMITLAEKIKF